MELAAGSLDRRLRIERRVEDAAADGAGAGTWVTVAEVWANVRDILPSRSERLQDGINISARPARVRIRERDDVTADMRFLLMRRRDMTAVERVMQIVSGPAIVDLGGLEFMAEDYSSAGNG